MIAFSSSEALCTVVADRQIIIVELSIEASGALGKLRRAGAGCGDIC